jgi:hypothetical protein
MGAGFPGGIIVTDRNVCTGNCKKVKLATVMKEEMSECLAACNILTLCIPLCWMMNTGSLTTAKNTVLQK